MVIFQPLNRPRRGWIGETAAFPGFLRKPIAPSVEQSGEWRGCDSRLEGPDWRRRSGGP